MTESEMAALDRVIVAVEKAHGKLAELVESVVGLSVAVLPMR
jgi:hypothetical protein